MEKVENEVINVTGTNYTNEDEIEFLECWKLGEFVTKFNSYFSQKYNVETQIRTNTINNYFRELESKIIHYVQRMNNVKVYDKKDLEILEFIVLKRSNNKEINQQQWNLEDIYKHVAQEFECRTVTSGVDEESTGLEQFAFVLEKFKNEIRHDIDKQAEINQKQIELAAANANNDIKLKKSYLEIMTKQRELKKEAIAEWGKLPAEKRLEGLFFKRERHNDREAFIDDFIEKKTLEWMLELETKE